MSKIFKKPVYNPPWIDAGHYRCRSGLTRRLWLLPAKDGLPWECAVEDGVTVKGESMSEVVDKARYAS